MSKYDRLEGGVVSMENLEQIAKDQPEDTIAIIPGVKNFQLAEASEENPYVHSVYVKLVFPRGACDFNSLEDAINSGRLLPLLFLKGSEQSKILKGTLDKEKSQNLRPVTDEDVNVVMREGKR